VREYYWRKDGKSVRSIKKPIISKSKPIQEDNSMEISRTRHFKVTNLPNKKKIPDIYCEFFNKGRKGNPTFMSNMTFDTEKREKAKSYFIEY